MPSWRALAGHGHVHASRLPAGRPAGLAFSSRGRSSIIVLDIGAHLVGQLADDRALLGREGAHLLEDGGQLPFFAQDSWTRTLSSSARSLQAFQVLQRGFLDVFKCCFHLSSLLFSSNGVRVRWAPSLPLLLAGGGALESWLRAVENKKRLRFFVRRPLAAHFDQNGRGRATWFLLQSNKNLHPV